MMIVFFVRRLCDGGADRVAAELTRIWTKLGHRVIILTMCPQDAVEYDHACQDREHVDWLSFDREAARRLHVRYHFEIAIFNDGINDGPFSTVFLAVKSLGIKTLIINHHTANNWLYTLVNSSELANDELFRQADGFVCVDPIWTIWWQRRTGNAIYVPNPIVSTARRTCAREKKLLVWIGRISDTAKQASRMMSVFTKVAADCPDIRLIMLGARTVAAERALRIEVPHQLQAQIEFAGFEPQVSGFLSRAAIHVMTSLTEVTVPQVILEAQSVGAPTVAFDIPVLRNVPGVELVVTDDQMAEKIIELLRKERKLEALALYGFRSANTRSGVVEDVWNNLLDAIQNPVQYDGFRKKNVKDIQNENVYGNLLDEIHRADLYFSRNYLADYRLMCRLRLRLNPIYVLQRLLEKSKHFFCFNRRCR
jgi:glycosyltransferase involved in cell wall biosynthesis